MHTRQGGSTQKGTPLPYAGILFGVSLVLSACATIPAPPAHVAAVAPEEMWVHALKTGDMTSAQIWRQHTTQSPGDRAFFFLPDFRDIDWSGAPRITRIRTNTPGTYLITGHFVFPSSSVVNLYDSATVTVVAVKEDQGWKLDNTLLFRTASWPVRHIGPLAIHTPANVVLPAAWADAAHFADSLARAYGVVLPDSGLIAYAAPSVSWIAGVDSSTSTPDVIAYTDPLSHAIVSPVALPAENPGTLRHEIAHYVLARAAKGPLSWALSEGAASYYGGGYGCPTAEAFLRRMTDQRFGTPDSTDLDLGAAHQESLRGQRQGFMGGFLAVALADERGGPGMVTRLLQADARFGTDSTNAGAAAVTRNVGTLFGLHGAGATKALNGAFLAFGRSRGATLAAAFKTKSHPRMVCENEK